MDADSYIYFSDFDSDDDWDEIVTSDTPVSIKPQNNAISPTKILQSPQKPLQMPTKTYQNTAKNLAESVGMETELVAATEINNMEWNAATINEVVIGSSDENQMSENITKYSNSSAISENVVETNIVANDFFMGETSGINNLCTIPKNVNFAVWENGDAKLFKSTKKVEFPNIKELSDDVSNVIINQIIGYTNDEDNEIKRKDEIVENCFKNVMKTDSLTSVNARNATSSKHIARKKIAILKMNKPKASLTPILPQKRKTLVMPVKVYSETKEQHKATTTTVITKINGEPIKKKRPRKESLEPTYPDVDLDTFLDASQLIILQRPEVHKELTKSYDLTMSDDFDSFQHTLDDGKSVNFTKATEMDFEMADINDCPQLNTVEENLKRNFDTDINKPLNNKTNLSESKIKEYTEKLITELKCNIPDDNNETSKDKTGENINESFSGDKLKDCKENDKDTELIDDSNTETIISIESELDEKNYNSLYENDFEMFFKEHNIVPKENIDYYSSPDYKEESVKKVNLTADEEELLLIAKTTATQQLLAQNKKLRDRELRWLARQERDLGKKEKVLSRAEKFRVKKRQSKKKLRAKTDKELTKKQQSTAEENQRTIEEIHSRVKKVQPTAEEEQSSAKEVVTTFKEVLSTAKKEQRPTKEVQLIAKEKQTPTKEAQSIPIEEQRRTEEVPSTTKGEEKPKEIQSTVIEKQTPTKEVQSTEMSVEIEVEEVSENGSEFGDFNSDHSSVCDSEQTTTNETTAEIQTDSQTATLVVTLERLDVDEIENEDDENKIQESDENKTKVLLDSCDTEVSPETASKCSHCDRIFQNDKLLRQHVNDVIMGHLDNNGNNTEKKMDNEEIKLTHTDLIEDICRRTPLVLIEDFKSFEDDIPCLHCDELFNTEKDLKHHVFEVIFGQNAPETHAIEFTDSNSIIIKDKRKYVRKKPYGEKIIRRRKVKRLDSVRTELCNVNDEMKSQNGVVGTRVVDREKQGNKRKVRRYKKMDADVASNLHLELQAFVDFMQDEDSSTKPKKIGKIPKKICTDNS